MASLNINVGASIGGLQKAIAAVSGLLKNFGGEIAGTNAQLRDAIQKASADMDKAMADVTKSFDTFGKEATAKTEKVANSTKSLRTQLREATMEAAKLSQQYGMNSQQAIEAQKKAGALKDEMGDLNARIAAFNPDARFKAFTDVLKGASGAVGAVTGGLQLMGVEGETAQQAMAKLQAIMAVTQGLDAIKGLGDAFSTVKASIIATVTQMGIMKTALVATGIGAVVVLVASLASMWDDVAGSTNKAADALDRYTSFNDSVAKMTDLDTRRMKAGGASDERIAQKKLSDSRQAILTYQQQIRQLQQTEEDEEGRRAKGIQARVEMIAEERVKMLEYANEVKELKAKAAEETTKKHSEELHKQAEASRKYHEQEKKWIEEHGRAIKLSYKQHQFAAAGVAKPGQVGGPMAPPFAMAGTGTRHASTKEDAVQDALKARMQVMNEYNTALAMTTKTTEALANAMATAFADAAILIAESIGQIAMGTFSLNNFFGGLLGIVANFGEQLGKQFIAMGTASLVAQTSLLAGPAGAASALAAGIALVAASQVVKGYSSKLANKGMASFDVGSRYVPYDMTARIHQGEMIIPKRENPYANSGGRVMPGGRVQVYGRVTGNDIELSSTKFKRWQNRVI